MSNIGIRVRPLHSLRWLVTVTVLVLLFAAANNCLGQENPTQTEEQRQAREALSKGVQDFENGQYDEAIVEFRRAKQSDPQLLNARLYLATAYALQYIPGAPSEENRRNGEAAVAEFREVLSLQPDNLSAIDGIGSILFQMAGQPFDAGKFSESMSQFQKHIQLRPDDPEPYYWIGAIDWTLSFLANGELRERFNRYARGKELDNADPLPQDLRVQYAQEYGPTIIEGIDALQKAIALRPDYDDAMAYLTLLYRRKADIVDGETEREVLIKMADDLIDTVKEIKTRRATPSS
jgi:tetratricopeptide (TPR) repeat protein